MGGSPSPPVSRPIALDGTWYQVETVDESEIFGLNLDGLDQNGVACAFPGAPADHPGGVDNSLPGVDFIGPTVAQRLFTGAVVHINQIGQVALYGHDGQNLLTDGSVNGGLDSPLAAGWLPRELDSSPQLVWLDGPLHIYGQVTAVSVGLRLSFSGGKLEMIVGAVVPDTTHNRGMFGSEACFWLTGWADSTVNAGPEDPCDGVSTGARLVAQEIPALSDSDIGPMGNVPVVCE